MARKARIGLLETATVAVLVTPGPSPIVLDRADFGDNRTSAKVK